jgi:ornithine decarboxylase
MHPIKTRGAMQSVFLRMRCAHLVLDSAEVDKIDLHRPETGEPAAICGCVRIRVSDIPGLAFASNSDASLIEAPRCCRIARQHCDWLGVCFHVGSQAMSPFAFAQALDRTRAASFERSVVIDDRHW